MLRTPFKAMNNYL